MTGIPDHWRWSTLNDLRADEPGAITDGPFGSNLTSAHYTSAGPRVVRLQNIGDGRFNAADAFIAQSHFESLRKHSVEPGDLLIASLGESLPRACLAPDWLGPAIVKADCVRARLGPEVDPRWVLYAIQTPFVRKWANEQLHGVGRPRLGLQVIRALPVPLPPLPEQRRIVDLLEGHLSRLQAGRRALGTAHTRLESLRASQTWSLTHGLSGVASRLSEVAEVRLGRQRSPGNHNGDNMHPYLRAANVDWDRLRLEDVKEMNFSASEVQTFALRPNDILVVEASGSPGEVGKSAIYRDEVLGSVCFQNTLIRVRCHRVNPEFMQRFLLAEAMNGRFIAGSRGVGIHHIGGSKLAAWPVVVPSAIDQAAAVRRLAEADAGIGRLGSELGRQKARLAQLRRSLLVAAFSGSLTESWPDPEDSVHD